MGDGDITVPSAHSVFAGTLDTNVAAVEALISHHTRGRWLDSNIDINVNPKGTGSLVVGKVAIGGAIDSTIIGGSTPAAGTFTTHSDQPQSLEEISPMLVISLR